MRLLLLRPPRYVWPFNSETSAFWQPLGLLCLAATIRRSVPGAEVEVWDAPAYRWGWRTLQHRLAERPFDVLGIGEETVSAHEGLRAAQLARQLWPGCVVVAGGVYYPYAIERTLGSGCVDVIVRGEGEVTFVELLRCLHDRPSWHQIAGLAFRDQAGQTVITPARSLIEDLDTTPMPAYDLLDMSAYGRRSRNHPGLVSVEHSRGCTDSCSFCILWKHMGRSVDGNGRVRPCYRTKSPQRSFDEVHHLYRRFDRRTFGWVDPTFNASADWTDGWAERMLASEMMDARGRPRTIHTAWLRADGIIRDHKLGILDKIVRAGLRQVMIGVERDDPDGLETLGKHNNGPEVTDEAFAILRERYPRVFTIATVIYGLPTDTRADLDRLLGWQDRSHVDYLFIMPLTPNPGTETADQARCAGMIANPDLASYNFHTPVCRTESLGLRDLESVYWRAMFRPNPWRIEWLYRRLLVQRDPRIRRVSLALFLHGSRIAARSLLRRLCLPNRPQPTLYSRRPSWYET